MCCCNFLRKVARLRRLAAAWLLEREGAGAGQHFPEVRVDVVGVARPRTGPCVIEHLVGVA